MHQTHHSPSLGIVWRVITGSYSGGELLQVAHGRLPTQYLSTIIIILFLLKLTLHFKKHRDFKFLQVSLQTLRLKRPNVKGATLGCATQQ